ncbi:hypothetical protein IW150_005873, partial [Coemansia sp. RSA 2607]
MMTDLDLDSKAILNGLVYLDQHNILPPSASGGLGGQKQAQQSGASKADDAGNRAASQTDGASKAVARTASTAPGLTPQQQQQLLPGMSPKTAAGHFSGAGPHAIATLKVETSAVLKELARFRACDDQTMSCFYCREWAQWVYRKQISPQAAAAAAAANGSVAGTVSATGGRKKKKGQQQQQQQQQAVAVQATGGSASDEAAAAERERLERKRAARMRYNTIGDLCKSLRSMVTCERELLLEAGAGEPGSMVSRPSSPAPSVSSATSSNATGGSIGGKAARGKVGGAGRVNDADDSEQQADSVTATSQLIDQMVDEVSLWCDGYQFPLADVYEDLTFDFPPDAFPYDDNQDPLDPALLLPALQVTKTFISLPASSFPLLGNITSELIATHTYPTCQHTKADHPTPSELETQRLIFNSQLNKWRVEYKRNFEREMEPVWQITQLLLKSAQRIEAMRVRLFARGCRANREQFLQTIRNRTQPFAEFWARVSEPYRTGKAAAMAGLPPVLQPEEDGSGTDGQADQSSSPSSSKRARTKRGPVKTPAQLAEELDSLVFVHLDNLLEVSATWSRSFLESYYGVAREFAR